MFGCSCSMSAHLEIWVLRAKSNINACYWGEKSLLRAAIRSTVVRLSSLTFILHLTALFSCPWQPNTSQAFHTWWSHPVIYRLAALRKSSLHARRAPGGEARHRLLPAMPRLYWSRRRRCDVWLTESFLFHSAATKPAFHSDVKTVKDSSPTCFLKGKTVVTWRARRWMLTLLCKYLTSRASTVITGFSSMFKKHFFFRVYM